MNGEPSGPPTPDGLQPGTSEQLYHRIFETSPVAILVVDPDSEAVLEANHAVAELYGTTRERLIGVPYFRLTGDLERGLEPALYGVPPGARVVTPADHKRSDGTVLDLEITATPFDHHGISAMLCVLRPTPKPAAGPDLPVPRADASDLVQGFVAEFGALLNHMRGYADELMVQIAGLHGDPVGARELGDHIGRGDLLVRQLRVLDGREIPMPETFDLNEVIAGAEVFLSPVLRPDIQLVLEPGTSEVELHADRTQLEMAVACLVSCSVNAMPDGGRVAVRSGALTSELGWFAVEDEGAPIQQDSLPLLFEPFQDPSLLGRRTGLELAAFKRVIDGLSGEVEVTSGGYRSMSVLVMLLRAK